MLKLNVMKQLNILITYLKLNRLKDEIKYTNLKTSYEALSKQINKFIEWVQNNWNSFPSPETGNQ